MKSFPDLKDFRCHGFLDDTESFKGKEEEIGNKGPVWFWGKESNTYEY